MFVAAALSFALGIYIEALCSFPVLTLLPVLLILLGIVPFLIARKPPVAAYVMIILFIATGMLRLGMVTTTRAPVPPDGEKQVWEGLVTESSPSAAIIRITGPEGMAGFSAVYRTDMPLVINDRVKVFGSLYQITLTSNNPSLTSWKWIKSLEGVWYEIKGALVSVSPGTNHLHQWRSYLARKIEASGAKYTGIIKALTMGDTTGLDEETRALFMRTGTSHILAISGSHIGIVTAFFFFLARFAVRRFHRLRLRGDDIRYAALLSIPFAFIFMLTAGSSIPTVRATIMVTVFMTALFFERGTHIPNSLALSALVILLLFPHSLFSASFQLTFASVVFIVVCSGRLSPLLQKRNRAVRWFLSSVLMTVAATLGTLPIVAYHFFGVNPFSVIHNLIAVPLMCIFAMPLGLLGLLLPWGDYLLRLSGDIIAFTIYILKWMDWGYVYPIVRPTLFECLLYFSLILSSFYLRAKVIAAGLVFVLVPLTLVYGIHAWNQRFNNSSLCVNFIDVGLGDAILVEAPRGIRILIDGGGQVRGSYDAGRSVVTPLLLSRKIRTLDYVINTHPHADHAGGLIHILQHFKVKRFATGACFPREPWFIDLLAVLRERAIPVEVWKRGHSLVLPDGALVKTLSPGRNDPTEDPNDASLVLRLVLGRISFLLTGDIGREAEERLVNLRIPLRSTVLKVPHHGSRFSSSPAFVGSVKPHMAVMSVGRGIRGLPAEDALNVYKALSIPLVRTDRHGFTALCSNGREITCNSFLKRH